ncbi:MAG: glycosyltransferase family 2 protein, partial [Acidobacteriota bacterium]|nr:glycosyltransferase family 2 protein [Acidobacteriota bacterium]
MTVSRTTIWPLSSSSAPTVALMMGSPLAARPWASEFSAKMGSSAGKSRREGSSWLSIGIPSLECSRIAILPSCYGMHSLDWTAWIFAGGWLGMLALLHRNSSKLEHLPEPSRFLASPGSVCLCMPARNEAAAMGGALDSWLAQDYPDFTLLVVDDGSTDGTSEILAERASLHPHRLRILRNDSLPAGWLGKNHALHLAVRQPEAVRAKWLLFVDADVHATPDLLSRVFAYLEQRPADILALLFAVDAVG